MSRQLTTEDDTFHPAGPEPWWTETVWFAWLVPERQLIGYFYPVFRPNLGVYGGGVTVFDGTAELPWELPFHAWDWHRPIPDGLDLRHARLDNGMTLVAEEPGAVYSLGYEHRDELALRLRYEAVTEPLVTDGVPPFNHGHVDQLGRVTGTMVLHGEEIAVDCLAMRDRSWGPRREGPQPRAGYSYAGANAGTSFLAVSVDSPRSTGIGMGFLARDGAQSHLVSGHRQVERDRAGRPVSLHIRAHDDAGRPLVADGVVVSRQALVPYSSMLCWNSLVRWEVDGVTCWGEDQDVWHPRTWRRFTAERQAAEA